MTKNKNQKQNKKKSKGTKPKKINPKSVTGDEKMLLFDTDIEHYAW